MCHDPEWGSFLWSLCDWPSGTIMILIMAIAVLLAVVLLFTVAYSAADTAWISTQKGVGRVTQKEFIPEHTESSIQYNAALKMPMPTTHHVPDEWWLSIEFGGEQDSIEVTEETFNSTKIGDSVPVSFGRGRLSGNLHIKDFA